MPRSRPLPPDWAKRRLAALRRDKFKCVKCGRRASEVDHVKPAWAGGSDDLVNLQSLCHQCHAPKTAQDQRDATAHWKKLNKRTDKAPWQA